MDQGNMEGKEYLEQNANREKTEILGKREILEKTKSLGKRFFHNSYVKFVLLTVFSFLMGIPLWGVWQLTRAFVVDSFLIPTESMVPTLVPGNRIFVNKLLLGARIYRDFHFDKRGIELQSMRTKGLREMKRNDIVVFNFPINGDEIKFVINYVYCKRCVGLPGDSVSIVKGYYKNNNYAGVLGYEPNQRAMREIPDSLLPAQSLRAMPFDDHLEKWTIKDFGPLYIPRAGDRIPISPKEAVLYRKILEWELKGKLRIDWDAHRVYLGHRLLQTHVFQHDYFFMAGDNVQNSYDSRYWGLVPDTYVTGIVCGKWDKKYFF